MGYLDIVYIIFIALASLSALFLLHFLVFTLIGLFTKKRYPETDEKCKYGIIISARNEEKVIARLIKSISATDYPQDKLTVFVLAHNCTDRTAELARAAGAVVYEYNNSAERTLGYAYKALFGFIERDYGTASFDGFLVMNADNVVTKNYISKMNDAFVYNGKECVVTSYRNSKNFSQNYMSCLYGIFFISACRLESRGRTVCNCSTRVSGTGYVFNSAIVKDGWPYVSLTEDWEFSADRIACGTKILYCDDAEFFDEQPTGIKIMLRQRMRWAKGHMDVFFTRFKKVVSSIFHPRRYSDKKEKDLMSKYDIGVQIMPLGVISVTGFLIELVCLGLSPLFGYDAGAVFGQFFMWYGIMTAGSYVLCVIAAALVAILERKRIGKVGFFKMLSAVLLWPFFILLNVFLDVAALFIRKLEWKPIPHSYNAEELAEPENNIST